ncbi:MAG: sulfur carrier protein ThiS [Micrococcus sp.]|nr:sulfur carrier protein ThiS [Micrococcus sp.]
MSLTLNGTPHSLSEHATVRDAVAAVTGRPIDQDGRAADGGRLGVAVAVNETLVPRSAWSGHALQSGDVVDVVTAVQGG